MKEQINTPRFNSEDRPSAPATYSVEDLQEVVPEVKPSALEHTNYSQKLDTQGLTPGARPEAPAAYSVEDFKRVAPQISPSALEHIENQGEANTTPPLPEPPQTPPKQDGQPGPAPLDGNTPC